MRHRNRRAFTLIEILAVIGVILVLVGMAVIGFNVIDRGASGKSTRATLENLRGLVDEFAAQNGTGLLEGPAAPPAVYQTGSPAVNAPGDVNNYDNLNTARYNDGSVFNTQKIMGVLMRIPRNTQMVRNLPTKQLLPAPPGGSPAITLSADAGGNPSPPVILDAWKNPIIFVPAEGLVVTVTTSTTKDGNGNPQSVTTQKTVKSPDGRPFWASAGPDGDFSKGDDNIYSFE